MSILNIHLHSPSSCHSHEPARSRGGENALRQGMTAAIVAELLERLMHAGSQGGVDTRGPSDGAGNVGGSGPLAPGREGDGPQGVLKPFMALLVLLALLTSGKGRHAGPANDVADRVADKLPAGPDVGPGSTRGIDFSPKALPAPAAVAGGGDPFEEALQAMLGARREGRATSLMAGQDDAGFERELQAFANSERQRHLS